jgi:hypothetical protein
MAIEGTLEVFQLPEILQMIAAQRKTGILTVQGESDIVAVSFKDGQVVAADALNQTVEEGLGQVLASQGLVNPRDFAAVSAEHEAGGKRLLDLLLERGHVHRDQLLEALRLQTYRLLLQLLRWDQGEFKFYSGDEVAYEEGFYAISVEELLIRSLSDLGDDGQGGTMPTLETAYELAPGGPPIRYVGEDGVAEGSGVWLTPEERVMVQRLDGSATARDMAVSTGLGDYRVLFTLYRLLRAGAVRPAGRRSPPQPAPRAAAVAAPPAAARPSPAAPPAGPPPPRGPAPGGRSKPPAPEPGPLLPETDEPAVAPAARPGKVLRMRAPVAPARLGGIARAAPLLIAAAVACGALATPWLAPRRLVLPLPWQDATRAALERNQRAASHLQLDRAARTYFLLEGHYPDGLEELVALDLLPAAALLDPARHPLRYSSDERSYEVTPVVDGRPVPELGTREAITGDFLLDPDFLRLPDRPERPPLVLLD